MPEKEDKKAFALRLSAKMLKDLETWANEEFRSTNGQIEFLLNQALASRKKKKDTKSDS